MRRFILVIKADTEEDAIAFAKLRGFKVHTSWGQIGGRREFRLLVETTDEKDLHRWFNDPHPEKDGTLLFMNEIKKELPDELRPSQPAKRGVKVTGLEAPDLSRPAPHRPQERIPRWIR